MPTLSISCSCVHNFLISAFVCTVVVCSFASTTTLAYEPKVFIEYAGNASTGSRESIRVFFDPNRSGFRAAAFELMISYDATVLEIDTVMPGQLLTSCHWDFFVYQTGAATPCGTGCPEGVIRIVGMSWNPPSCYLGDTGPGAIAVMKFTFIGDIGNGCKSFPIRFFWSKCSDNTFVPAAGYPVYTADSVFWSDQPNHYYPIPAGLYTNAGMPASCFPANPHRLITFREGAVVTACPLPSPICGDTNFDEVINMGDAVALVNHIFLHMPLPWGPPSADMNCDFVKTLADVVYLVNYIFNKGPAPCAGCK